MFIKTYIPEQQIIDFFIANDFTIEERSLPYYGSGQRLDQFTDVPVIMIDNHRHIRLDELMQSFTKGLLVELIIEGKNKETKEIINSLIEKLES